MIVILLCAAQLAQETARTAEVVVTASAFADDPLQQPFSLETLDQTWLRTRARTVPEALQGLPGVMVQKTASGQSSPFLRGFTGFRTRMLVDGIPLNHAAMRSGPNQYWSTLDALTVERLELVRGTSSVLYGSDAIGGTVNAISRRAKVGAEGLQIGGGSFTRYSSAEDSWTQRAEVSMASGSDWGFLGGSTVSHYGDLESGDGTLPETGYSQYNGDFRFDRYFSNGVVWTTAGQTVRQENVPRTHKTIFAVPFQGTSVGSELQRDHDQRRDLFYTRVAWDRGRGLTKNGEVTLSYQRHKEIRDRLRTGARRDLQGFDLDDIGLTARFESDARASGIWSWGTEVHHQSADSFRDNFVADVLTSSAIQGAIGDDSTYDSAAVYLQNEMFVRDDLSIIPGLRASWFSLESDRVENPDPSGPTILQLDESWTALTGSLRGVWYLSQENTVFAGLSQGFRAPNLSDLTSFEATSAVETPSPNLDPENYLQFEIGSKGRGGQWSWQTSVYQTWIDDMIVQSPTGALIDGVPEVQKSNAGDGWVHGVEVDVQYELDQAWSVFANASWMDGEVDQVELPSGATSRAPLSRLAPMQGNAGVRWQQNGGRWWGEAWMWAVDNQDDLALRDTTDTSRIPAGGTPGFTLFGLSGGVKISENARWSLSLENLGDKNYRVHGSGINGPGFNLVSTVELNF
ncbi:MAG: TonB-dependent receptor [Planctomycetota bacterium]|nr:TonB-dependent receptor [Planctomycetota bacterium]